MKLVQSRVVVVIFLLLGGSESASQELFFIVGKLGVFHETVLTNLFRIVNIIKRDSRTYFTTQY